MEGAVNGGQFGLALQELAVRQLTFEHTVLEMISKVFHRAMDFPQSFIIADIVGNQIGTTHCGPLEKKGLEALRWDSA
jgi:hypothetical protein